MIFEEIVSVLETAFQLDLKVVEDATAFEVASADGGTKVRVLIQSDDTRKLVLMSADIGGLPPEGGERLFRTLLEANNLFSQTAGATLALDPTALRFRLQQYESPDELANDIEKKIVSFIETALFWCRAIADYRPSDFQEDMVFNDFRMMQV